MLPTFYINGLIYMMVRIAINVIMTIQPFYLEEVTEFKSQKDEPTSVTLAIVPLISYSV